MIIPLIGIWIVSVRLLAPIIHSGNRPRPRAHRIPTGKPVAGSG
jgi:hypothetical protein